MNGIQEKSSLRYIQQRLVYAAFDIRLSVNLSVPEVMLCRPTSHLSFEGSFSYFAC